MFISPALFFFRPARATAFESWRRRRRLISCRGLTNHASTRWSCAASLALCLHSFLLNSGLFSPCSCPLSLSLALSLSIGLLRISRLPLNTPQSPRLHVAMGAFQSMFSRLWSKKEVRILILGLVLSSPPHSPHPRTLTGSFANYSGDRITRAKLHYCTDSR